MASQDVSILNDITIDSSRTGEALYSSSLSTSQTTVDVTTSGGLTVSAVQIEQEQSTAVGDGTYVNIYSLDTPVSASLGHATQLKPAVPTPASDGTFHVDYQQFTYQTVDVSNALPPSTPVQGTTDPVSQISLALNGQNDGSSAALPMLADQAGHPQLNNIFDYWNGGGDLAIDAGNIKDLLDVIASTHPKQEALLKTIDRFTDISNYNIYQTNTGDPVQDAVGSFYNDSRGALRDVLVDGIKGASANFGESVQHLKTLYQDVYNFESNLVGIFQSNVKSF